MKNIRFDWRAEKRLKKKVKHIGKKKFQIWKFDWINECQYKPIEEKVSEVEKWTREIDKTSLYGGRHDNFSKVKHTVGEDFPRSKEKMLAKD
jgi:hypothetical protein